MKKNFILIAFAHLIFSAIGQGLWEQRANPPQVSDYSVSFTINSLGYVVTDANVNNFYMYDPVADTWSAKADFPGGGRLGAAGFATDSFGYVGGGSNDTFQRLNDFYRYDPVNNSWTTRANYPDSVEGAFAFCINNTGYFAGGMLPNRFAERKCYAYDAVADQWIQKTSLPIDMCYGFSAVVNGRAYCGLGQPQGAYSHLDSVYKYDPSANSWQSKQGYTLTYGGNQGNLPIYSFVINNLIYVAHPGAVTNYHGEVGIFDPVGNSWSRINTFPYPSSVSCNPLKVLSGLIINNRGFLGNSNMCTNNSFWEFDPSKSLDVNFISPDTLCENDLIQVTFSSSLTFNAGNYFKLKFNGSNYIQQNAFSDSVAGSAPGTYTFKVPRLLFSGNTTQADVALYSTNPQNQASYFDSLVYIKRAPYETHWAHNYNICAGTSILLYRTGGFSETHYWSFWGNLDTTFNNNFVAFSGPQSGTVYVTDAYTPTGCRNAVDSTVINYYNLPSLQITDSSFSICPGSSVSIGGTTVSNGSYSWTGGTTSSAVNPVVTPSANTSYHVVLTDTVSGCKSSGNTSVVLAQPPGQTICFVTVDSTSTHNIIIWEKLDKPATDSFIIYREITTNNYQPIGAVHRDSLSEFHDYTANPNVTAYRYKISANDTCNNEALSPYHNTIHLQYLGSGNLIWNVYEIENSITPVNSFDVYRDVLGNGNWQIMVSVPGSQYTATDINFNQHPSALYRVVANWAYTCTASRSGSSKVLSNIISINGTAVSELTSGNEIHLYPNPVANEFSIISGINDVESVRVTSIDGRNSIILKSSDARFDIGSLAKGVYITEIIFKTFKNNLIGNTVRMKLIKM